MNFLERRKWAKLNLNFVMDHAAMNAVENVTKILYRIFIDKYLAAGERKIFLLKFLHWIVSVYSDESLSESVQKKCALCTNK